MVPGYQLGLGFRYIERRAMGFSQSGDEKNDEAEELRHNKPETALCLDDVRQVEGACKRDRTHER